MESIPSHLLPAPSLTPFISRLPAKCPFIHLPLCIYLLFSWLFISLMYRLLFIFPLYICRLYIYLLYIQCWILCLSYHLKMWLVCIGLLTCALLYLFYTPVFMDLTLMRRRVVGSSLVYKCAFCNPVLYTSDPWHFRWPSSLGPLYLSGLRWTFVLPYVQLNERP